MIKFYPFNLPEPNDQIKFYSLQILGTKFLLTKGNILQDMTYFSPKHYNINDDGVSSEPIKKLQDNKVTKTENPFILDILFFEKNHKFLKKAIKLNLQCVQFQEFSDIDIYLITSFEDLYLLPYLCKQKDFKAKIYCPHPIYNLGQHAVKEMINLIKTRNLVFQEKLSSEEFLKESEAYEIFEEIYHNNFQEFAPVFNENQFDMILQSVIKVNFGQVEEVACMDVKENIYFKPVQNGVCIGSALWQFQLGTGIKFSIVTELGLNDQRHCLIPTPNLFDQDSFCILTETQQTRVNCLTTFLSTVETMLGYCKNILVPINDLSLLLDLQGALANNFQRAMQIYIISNHAKQFIDLANSNVYYLNKQLQAKIFQDPPTVPFQNIIQLIKSGKITVVSSLEDLVLENQRYQSIQVQFQQSSPSVFFVYDSSIRVGQSNLVMSVLDEIYSPKQQPMPQTSFAVMLTDPNFQDIKIFSPYTDKYKLSIFYYPIDFKAPLTDCINFFKGTKCPTLYIDERVIQEYNSHQIIAYKPSFINIIPIEQFSTDQPKFTGKNEKKSLINIQRCSLKIQEGSELIFIRSSDDSYRIFKYTISNQTKRTVEQLAHELSEFIRIKRMEVYYFKYNQWEIVFSDRQCVVQMEQNQIKLGTINNYFNIAEIENILVKSLCLEEI